MKVKDLNEAQIKQIFCSAMGWHSQFNEQNEVGSKFDEFYDQITYEWDENRWTIWGDMAQIEITEDLYFRCGMRYAHYGIGGTAFDLKSVFECLISLGLLPLNEQL